MLVTDQCLFGTNTVCIVVKKKIRTCGALGTFLLSSVVELKDVGYVFSITAMIVMKIEFSYCVLLDTFHRY